MNTSWPSRAAALLALATFGLIFVGGLVTSTGSGLAVPDWPLSFGQLFPRMEGGVLFEHGHRLYAASVGILTIVTAVVVQRWESRAWVRRLAWSLLGVVVVQGVLGGVTVLLRLPDAISVAHAGLAQVFFALTVTLATVTARGWLVSPEPAGAPDAGRTRTLSLATAAAIYGQILLGAVVRHTGAGLAIPDFPLSQGRLVPAFTSSLVAWQYAHRVGALAVTVLVCWTAGHVIRHYRVVPWLRRPALQLLALVALQVWLGGLAVWARKAVIPTTAHVATGALLFATAVALALRVHRRLAEAPASALVPQEAS